MGVAFGIGPDQDQRTSSQGSLIMKIMGLASLLLFVLLVTSSTASPRWRQVSQARSSTSQDEGAITNFLEIDLLKIQAIKCKIGNILRIASLSAPCDDEFLRRVDRVG